MNPRFALLCFCLTLSSVGRAVGSPEAGSAPNQISHEKGAIVISRPEVTFGGATYPVGFSTYGVNEDAEQQRRRELSSLCLRYDVQAKAASPETETIPAGEKVAVMEVAALHPTGRVARVDTAMIIDGHKPEIVSRVTCKTTTLPSE